MLPESFGNSRSQFASHLLLNLKQKHELRSYLMIIRLPCLLVFAASSSSVITSDTSIKSAASRTVVCARLSLYSCFTCARARSTAAFLTKIMIYVAPTLEISYLFCVRIAVGSIMSHKGLDLAPISFITLM